MSFITVDWDFGRLQELIDARGSEVIVETGLACPCRNGDAYASTIDVEGFPGSIRTLSCPKCQGDGYIFRNARCVLGLITGEDPGRGRELIDAGYAVPGTMIFSPSLHAGPISDFDRITELHAEPVSDGQVIMRNAANIEDNQALDTDLTVDEDRLWYMVDCVLWCEDANGVVYHQDSDFEIEDRKIVWTGRRPADRVIYTIKYTAYLEWIVYDTPFTRHDRNRSLAQRVSLRKKHVFIASGSKADTPAKRKDEQDDFTTNTEI